MARPLESDENTAGLHRIVLEAQGEGVYVFVYETADSAFPERDYLVETMDDAVSMCAEDYGVPAISWRLSAAAPLMGATRSRQ